MPPRDSVLILANGELNDGIAVRAACREAAFVIAADGGARLAAPLGLTPGLLIGDMDSIAPDLLETLRAAGVEIQRYPPEKDETDLELALHEAIQRDAQRIIVIGAYGGRIDQSLANIYLLNLAVLQGRDVRLVSGAQTARVFSAGEHTIPGARGDTVSLIPLGGDVTGARTWGLQYPLAGETLEFGPARGISNVISDDRAGIFFESGRLLVVHTQGRA
ncbi:MAG: thiamine diphosphokinase [Anaerolineales bacterium]